MMLNNLIRDLKDNGYKVEKTNITTLEVQFPKFYTLMYVTYNNQYMTTFVEYDGNILTYDTHKTTKEVIERIKFVNEKLK